MQRQHNACSVAKEKGKGKGCFIERTSTDQEIIMHQRSYIDHCLKNNDMTHA